MECEEECARPSLLGRLESEPEERFALVLLESADTAEVQDMRDPAAEADREFLVRLALVDPPREDRLLNLLEDEE